MLLISYTMLVELNDHAQKHFFMNARTYDPPTGYI